MYFGNIYKYKKWWGWGWGVLFYHLAGLVDVSMGVDGICQERLKNLAASLRNFFEGCGIDET